MSGLARGLACDFGTLDMSQEDKARALVEKAEKKLASWSLFGGGSKYEDAAEMYTKAANLFKVSKCCERLCRTHALAPTRGLLSLTPSSHRERRGRLL